MSIVDIQRSEWRIHILTTLRRSEGQSGYEGYLQEAIGRWHHQFPTRDQVREEMRWLRDAGLVVLHDNPTPDGVRLTATLTSKGEAVAYGRTVVDGVRRPGG